MKIINIINQNPYRQLGIFANASTKDRVAATGKLKAFLKVGRSMESPFDAVLPAIDRNVETVAAAEQQLTLPAEQMRHAQFWFVKATPIDEVAFNNLFAGDIVEAQNVWSKKLSVSALQNLIVCGLISNDYAQVMTYAQMLYGEHADEFRRLILGDDEAIATESLAYDFLDTLSQEVAASKIMPYLTIADWKAHFAEPLIEKLGNLVDEAKSELKGNSQNGIKIGNRLMKDAKPLLKELKSAIGDDVRYQMIADKAGNAVLQCAINCYNDATDKQIARDALDLANKAKLIVVSKIARDRCQENVNILEKVVAELPPVEVKAEYEAIQRLLVTFANQPDLIKYSIQLIKYSAEHMVSIKEKLGSEHQYYLKISTTIVNNALGNIISEVNSAQAGRDFSKLKHTLISAWRAQLYLDKFDIEPAYKKGRYKECRDALHNIIKECKGFEYSFDSSKYRYGCGWCNNLNVSDVDLRTEKEKLDDKAKSHKKAIITAIGIGIAILVLVAIFLIWGKGVLATTCIVIAVISGIITIISFIGEGNDYGCLSLISMVVFIVLSIVLSQKNKQELRQEEQEKLYEQISLNPTEELCSRYINVYMTYEHADDVREIWFNLLVNESRKFNYYASAEANSESYSSSSTKNPLQELEDLPWQLRSEYKDKAKSYLKNICDSLYNIAVKKSTVDYWKRYQRIVPSDLYRDSSEKIREIENRDWKTEPKAWKKATTENSLWAYEKYKSLYPKGAHINQCEKNIIDLEVSNIYAGEHGTLPTMDRIGYGTGSTSKVTVTNSTSYTLTILYSGPDSKRLIIEAGKTKSITLKNGQYRTAASVTAYKVNNYAGTEDLRGGSYSVEYYISTYRTYR